MTDDNSNKKQEVVLPSTMKGPPICSLVDPGNCQFGEELTAVSLKERYRISSTSFVLRFALPDDTKPLNLSTCACLLANATIGTESVTRPYTPISTNADIGYLDLLIKKYGPPSKLSNFLCTELLPGDRTVSFRHISFNVKLQASELFTYDHIGMLVGGTGITPMIQALHAILGNPNNNNNKPKVTMLYGSQTANDRLGCELLTEWEQQYPEQFQVIHILSHEPEEGSEWNGLRGFIDKACIESHFPPPTTKQNIKILICGPPPMYNALSGPREEANQVSGILGELGYSAQQVYKF